MKKTFTILCVLLSVALLFNCSGNKEQVADKDYEVIQDPFQDLQDMKNEIMDVEGGIAAVGVGTSMRQDMALKKAKIDAQQNLSELLETKVQSMRKSFVEEIGTADDVEINEAFTSVAKTLSQSTLRGAAVRKSKYIQKKGEEQYTAGVLLVISPTVLNSAILEEMQKKPKVYERFRASQAYEELQNEMGTYEDQE
mgnify:CR=1 FL=1